MASASTTEPIFNDTESDAINEYFATLIRNQSLNGWSANYSTNYLQLKDLEYLHDFIAGKINNKKNLSVKGSFTTSLKKIFTKKKRKIVPKTNNNNNKTRKTNKDELLKVTNVLSFIIKRIKTNNTDLIDVEFITLINETIDSLITNIILSDVYFKQKELSKTFITSTTRSHIPFNFITDSFLTYNIDYLDSIKRLQKDTQKTQKMLIKPQNIQLNSQTNNMSDLFQNFKKTFGRQAVANNTTMSLKEHNSKMIELYKKYALIFGRKAWTHNNNTVVGGMQKKQKKPNYKLSTHKSIKHTTSPYKKNNHKTLKRIKLINKH